MIRALSTAASGMAAQQTNLDTIANNLANVNTTAFKSQRAEFQDLMYQTYTSSGSSLNGTNFSPTAIQLGLGTKFSATNADQSQGPIQTTNNPLDLAITGSGFFQVTGPNGQTLYTRDGSFKQDVNGQVVTSDGYPLADDITIPNGATAVSVSGSGLVSAMLPGSSQPQQIGKIQLATFANPGGLTRIGQNLYQAGGASGDAQLNTPGQNGSGSIQNSALEGSNVQVVTQLTDMILAQRAYEMNSKVITTADQMLTTTNQMVQ